MTPMKLLIVDDDRVTRDLLKEVFEKEGYQIELAPSGEAAIRFLKKEDFPLILSDIRMLDVDGLGVLSFVREFRPRSVVLLMTGFGTMDGAIRAIQHGAFDYVSKPFQLDELKALVARAADQWTSNARPTERPSPSVPFQPKTLIGKSPQIVEVYKTLARATLSPSNVLIVGESGTGKELVARGIHDNSARREKRFVAVNCGALSETLLESELFGHVKGAFTGAIADKRGLFEESDHGTLFLDEVGDLPLPLQVKLLRFIQEGEFKPVGSHQTKRADVRLIAATHRDLDSEVQKGTFREDLYYRLKVILIHLPPLRSRMEDLPELVGHFLTRFADKIGKQASHVSDEAMALLKGYSWPGNVRELEHAIERAVTMTRTTVLYPEDFPPEISHQARGAVSPTDSNTSLEEVERAHIMKVLEDTRFNKSKAAAVLGIDRKTLHRKAQRYKIKLKTG